MSETAAAVQMRALLEQRDPGKTLCPSEVARALAGADGNWRGRMDEVHDAADTLLAENAVVLSWQGERLPKRDGPYRIGAPV